MSYEPFGDATGGVSWLHKTVSEDFTHGELAGFTEKHMQYAVYKCAHTVKLFLRVVLVLLVIYMLWALATYVADKVFGVKISFKKENLQYLGASTDVAREDRELYKPTLYETAAVTGTVNEPTKDAQGKPVVKPESFTEHMMTPEEKELANIKKSLK